MSLYSWMKISLWTQRIKLGKYDAATADALGDWVKALHSAGKRSRDGANELTPKKIFKIVLVCFGIAAAIIVALAIVGIIQNHAAGQ
jgi:hypothetical protein